MSGSSNRLHPSFIQLGPHQPVMLTLTSLRSSWDGGLSFFPSVIDLEVAAVLAEVYGAFLCDHANPRRFWPRAIKGGDLP
jgi:hypothetical protein